MFAEGAPGPRNIFSEMPGVTAPGAPGGFAAGPRRIRPLSPGHWATLSFHTAVGSVIGGPSLGIHINHTRLQPVFNPNLKALFVENPAQGFKWISR